MARRREKRDKSGYTGNEVQVVTFNLGRETYGVKVTEVREIVKLENITRVPRTQSFIEGVMNLRGQITTVVDLRRLMAVADASPGGAQNRIIVAEIGDSQMGLLVDSVQDVMRIAPESILPPPRAVSEQAAARYLSGICRLPDRLVLLLDVCRILGGEELGRAAETARTAPAPPGRAGVAD
jgi:purine-binding chemotaxis protein CheW